MGGSGNTDSSSGRKGSAILVAAAVMGLFFLWKNGSFSPTPEQQHEQHNHQDQKIQHEGGEDQVGHDDGQPHQDALCASPSDRPSSSRGRQSNTSVCPSIDDEAAFDPSTEDSNLEEPGYPQRCSSAPPNVRLSHDQAPQSSQLDSQQGHANVAVERSELVRDPVWQRSSTGSWNLVASHEHARQEDDRATQVSSGGTQSRRASFKELPHELISRILVHLNGRDRAALRGVHPAIRKRSALWRTIFVQIRGEARDPCDISADILDLIIRHTQFSGTEAGVDEANADQNNGPAGGRLDQVHIKARMCQCREHVLPVLDCLHLSRDTLSSLALPILDQDLCLDRLYNACPKLVTLDLRFLEELPGAMLTRRRFTRANFAARLFPLRLYFGPDASLGMDVTANLQGLTSLTSGLSSKVNAPTLLHQLQLVSRSLRVWCGVHTETITQKSRLSWAADSTINFPRLLFLQSPPFLTGCIYTCPLLREAYMIDLRRANFHPTTNFWRLGSMLQSWTQLVKLELMLPHDQEGQRAVLSGVGKLVRLTNLEVHCPTLQVCELWPTNVGRRVHVPCPGLEKLVVHGLVDCHDLVKLVSLRNSLSQKLTWFEAIQTFQHLVQWPQSELPLVDPEPESPRYTDHIAKLTTLIFEGQTKYVTRLQEHYERTLGRLVPGFNPLKKPVRLGPARYEVPQLLYNP